MRVGMRHGQPLTDPVMCAVDDNGEPDRRMRYEQARQVVGQLQREDRNALAGAEIRQLRERRVPKAEPLPLVLGDLLALPDRVDQCPR